MKAGTYRPRMVSQRSVWMGLTRQPKPQASKYRPRMARERAKPIMRTVPREYRADYCRCVGMGYPMVESHVRMGSARGGRVSYVPALLDRLAKPDPGNLWLRCWMRSQITVLPKRGED